MTAAVYLGLADWGADAGGFYPEGLPEEWREAYYATQCSCVWLGAGPAGAVSAEQAAGWLRETPESFRFLFEDESQVPEALKTRSAGIDSVRLWVGPETRLPELSGQLQEYGGKWAEVYVLVRNGNLAQLEQVRTLIRLLGL